MESLLPMLLVENPSLLIPLGRHEEPAKQPRDSRTGDGTMLGGVFMGYAYDKGVGHPPFVTSSASRLQRAMAMRNPLLIMVFDSECKRRSRTSRHTDRAIRICGVSVV